MIKNVSKWFLLFAFVLSACTAPAPSATPSLAAPSQPATATTPTTIPPTITPRPTNTATLVPTITPTFTPSATPTPNLPMLGIQIYRTMDEIQFSLSQQAGASWTHFEGLPWDLIESQRRDPAVYEWNRADEQALLWASENNLNVIATILFAPAWAQKKQGYSCGPIREDALERFGDFLYAAVQRYSQPPYNIKYWELGNEPDVDPFKVKLRSPFGCWGVQGDPYFGGEYYAEMLKVAYPKIKAADPEAQVLVGGLLLICDPENPPINNQTKLPADCSSSMFLEGILKNGGGDFFDGVSLHAYDYYYRYGRYGNTNWLSNSSDQGPILNIKVAFVRSLLEKYDRPNKFLMATEVALLCRNTGREAVCGTGDYAKTKAFYVVQSMAAGYANNLRASIWFHLSGWRGSTLIDRSNQPLPEYHAYAFGARMMEKADYLGRVQDYERVTGYDFRLEDKQFWLIWSRDDTPAGLEQTIMLPEMPQAIYNVYGEELEVTQEIKLTVAPLYIVWQR